MKTKKLMIMTILILLLSPITIRAEVCNKNDIKIEKVELNEIRGNAEEISESNNNNNQINVNAKMNVIGDSLTYKVTIKNTSNSDYIFDENQIKKDYINYDISYEDESNIIKAGEEKIIYLRLNYQEKPQVENLTNGVFTSNNQVSFNLTKENTIENPVTGNNVILCLIIIFIIGIATTVISKKIKTAVIIISLLLIPQLVNAICTSALDINLNLEIDVKEATFASGATVNVMMKELAGDDTSTVTYGYNFKDQNITAIKYSETEPEESNKEEKNIVSEINSEYPIYMWYEDGTIYWWSEDKTPNLNTNASAMFCHCINLVDITGLKKLDSSNTTNISNMISNTSINSLEDIRNWNTSNIENMNSTFWGNHSLTSNSGIENWDVSKVISTNNLFNSCYEIEEIDLSGWKTDSLISMNNTFGMWENSGMPYYNSKLKRIILSENFNTSHVTNMYGLFANNKQIEDYSFLYYFDTRSVTDMQQMFQWNTNLQNTDYFKNWDISSVTTLNGTFQYTGINSLTNFANWNTSNVTNMNFTFRGCNQLTTLTGIENWNVSNVTQFAQTFANISNLNDASAINDWDIQGATNFSYMFYQTPTHPEFSKVQGTWSSVGTFSAS